MWCHLCDIDLSTFPEFKHHIQTYHSARKVSSESEESGQENADGSEIESNYENAASNMFEGNGYDSDHNIAAENKSDDSNAYINTSPRLFQYDSDRSINTENKWDNNTASAHTPQGKFYDSDYNVGPENNSHDKRIDLDKSPKKIDDNDDKTSASNTLTRKRKRCYRKKKVNVNATVSKTSPKKQTSILKKHVQKRKKKVAFSKKVSKYRLSASSDQEDIPRPSDNNEIYQSDSSFNEDSNHVDSQPVLSNSFVNSINNSINFQPISNNPILLVNSYAGQDVNNYVAGNQAVQPPLFVLNTLASNSTTSKHTNCFAFNSKNILKWLIIHKEFCKNIPYPLPPSFFNQLKTVHKAIFDRYCVASISEESSTVLKVYEELDCMIHKHINSINNTLNVL